MKRRIFCMAVVMLAVVASGLCQTPQYQFSTFSGSSVPGGGSGGTELEYKQQSLYSSHDFPGMPVGWVKAVYLQVARGYQVVNPAGNCTLKDFTLSIGYTYDSVYKSTGMDSFRTGLTTIYGPDTFSVPCNQAVGGAWIRIPVVQNAFRFDHEHFFAVEVAWGPNDTGSSGFMSFANSKSANDTKKRNGYVYMRNEQRIGALSVAKASLGFDLGGPVAGVTEQSNIQGVGLFPNPAPNGRFNISLDAKQAMQEVRVTISDITGRQIQSRQFAHPGTHSFEEINLSSAAPGIYFVRIEADGTVITRRVSVE